MCAKITQYSRISHHTIAGSASAGSTFSVPPQEDFTDGSWTPFDLALSEIGVNEEDKRVYIRIGDTIEELGVIGGSALGTTPSLFQVLQVGFNTDGEPIQFRDVLQNNIGRISNGLDDQLQISGGNYIELEGGINARMILDGLTSSIRLSDSVDYITEIIFTTQSTIINTEDLLTPKQGKLEVDRNFTYFAHFDGSSGSLSYIQAQDDTIDIQTQTSGGTLHQINMDSTGHTMNFITSPVTGEIAAIDLNYDVGSNETSIILRTQDNSSTEVSAINMTKEFISLFNSPNTFNFASASQINVGESEVTLTAADTVVFKVTGSNLIHTTTNPAVAAGTEAIYYHIENVATFSDFPTTLFSIPFPQNQSVITVKAIINGSQFPGSQYYGAEIFGVFKNVGGTVTQISTLDKSEKTDFATATTDIVISGTNIIIQVTGEFGTSIRWFGRFNYLIT